MSVSKCAVSNYLCSLVDDFWSESSFHTQAIILSAEKFKANYYPLKELKSEHFHNLSKPFKSIRATLIYFKFESNKCLN